MKYYVYYDDDYYENCGVGLRMFNTEPEALAFINERLAVGGKTPNQYTLFHGTQIPLKAAETVIRITTDR